MSYEEFSKDLDEYVDKLRFPDEETEIAKTYNAGLNTVLYSAKTVFLRLQKKDGDRNV